MPKPIKEFMESKLGDDNSKSFKLRLKQLMERIKIPRFKKSKSGDLYAELETEFSYIHGEGSGPGHNDGNNEWTPKDGHVKNPGEKKGSGGEISETYYSQQGGNNKAVEDGRGKDYPQIVWLSRSPVDSNIGQRDEGDMEDRIGRYVMNTNTLFINADFRLIHAVVNYWVKKLKISSTTEITVVRRAVHSSYELTLADAIIHTRHLSRTDGGEAGMMPK